LYKNEQLGLALKEIKSRCKMSHMLNDTKTKKNKVSFYSLCTSFIATPGGVVNHFWRSCE